ncbi:Immunogenic secreted protein [Streptococcus oralis]|uniref:Immunogenic secreted protein n=1 Tax=Streptococcus oralis TaxID=1303 RepID=A0A139MB44_STROR|nr:phage tail tip lysozyme [Streptococcus oralis]KXT60862.1 Immunogenic secreted protein [Streptococcus oralis]
MKKTRRAFALLGFFLPVLSFLFLMLLLGGLITSSAGGSSGSTTGKRTRLTAQEVAQKANISVERAEDVIKILNWQLSKEKFTLEGSSGSLANAERESDFDPKLTNPSGGVAGYFQWSGWDNTINGDRWANASSRTLDSTVELELMSFELNHGYKKVKDYMQKATDPFESAKYWSEHYEGVSLLDGQTKLEKLEKDSKKWYEVFKGTIEDGSSSGNAIAGSLDIAPGAVAMEIPNGYSIDKEITKEGYITQSYPYGECTWYVFNRAKEFGIQFDPYMGNGQDWAHKSGYEVTNTPTKHSAVSFQGRQAGGHQTYGHVAFVEDVKDDGSILISECNFVQSGQGTGITNYRVFGAEEARNFYYVIGK